MRVERVNMPMECLFVSLYCCHGVLMSTYFIHKPLIYCHFTHGVGEPCSFPGSDWKKLTGILTEALDNC